MRSLSQVFAITAMNLRNLPARLGASLIIVVGIGGVVAVLIALLSMAEGFESALRTSSNENTVLIMRGGSTSETTSNVCARCIFLIGDKPGIEKTDKGIPMVAGETYITSNIPKRSNNLEANMALRGVQPISFDIRKEVKIVSGRNFEFGRLEMIVGVKAENQFKGLSVGSTLPIRGAQWKVVGLFEAGGGIHESEAWLDDKLLSQSLNRPGHSIAVARLKSPSDFGVFKQSLMNDKQMDAEAIKMTSFYSEQSKAISSLIKNFGYSVGAIMAIGAIFAALNTMYSAVSTRRVEIATLRALGFSSIPIVVSVMIEALVLALIGGAIGATFAFLFFNGYTASTMGDAFSQVSFDFAVTPKLVVQGVVWSCILGLVGGLFPSIAAARVPVNTALRRM